MNTVTIPKSTSESTPSTGTLRPHMSGNTGTQNVCRKAGFQLHRLSDGEYRADMLLPKSLEARKHRVP